MTFAGGEELIIVTDHPGHSRKARDGSKTAAEKRKKPMPRAEVSTLVSVLAK